MCGTPMTDLTMMATKLWRMLRARAKVVNPVEAAELDPMPLEAMSETKARALEKEGLMEPELPLPILRLMLPPLFETC